MVRRQAAEYLSFGLQAANQNALGQRRESSKLYQRAAETALRLGLRGVAAGFEEADVRADALSGNCQTVRRLGVLRWHWPCAAMRPKRKKLAGRLRSCFQTEPSGMRCSYPRFALRSRLSSKRSWDHKGANWAVPANTPIGGQFYCFLPGIGARLRARGDTAKAGKTLPSFLALWKDSDRTSRSSSCKV